jgi:hypothetical protein
LLAAEPNKHIGSSAMNSKEPTRKGAKGKGVDADAARRTREERAVQIRKEKRFDRANIERRKVILLLLSTS